jgi:Mor family transcriptional regulator
MSYMKADLILPKEILILVQEYADGQYLYIPKKADNRKSWGENTASKQQIKERDSEIYRKYQCGSSALELADEYFLSIKSIQRILLKEKNKYDV